jgi:hypothetical protein
MDCRRGRRSAPEGGSCRWASSRRTSRIHLGGDLRRHIWKRGPVQQQTQRPFVQEVHVRIGPLAARLNRKEFAAVRQHMEEEGRNLKALTENGA